METPSRMKYEQASILSPPDSFVSTPAFAYSPHSPNTMNATEMLTPRSYDDESHFGSSVSGTPVPDIKPVKKRKSWGQQLPEPKTNLPPRKRAKTEDEKEQRRVERVLRNRRAAQSSRERKRLEVEALEAEKRAIERKNMDLEMRLADIEAKYRLLQQELERAGGSTKAVFRSYSVPTTRTNEIRPLSLLGFSQPIHEHDPVTVNPASLSPEIRPVAHSSAAYSSDMMQHPAAMLCDLQCQSEGQQRWMGILVQYSMARMQTLAVTYLIAISGVFLKILSLNQIADSLRKKSSLSSTTSILNSIIWMVTMTASSTNSFSVTTSTMNRLRPRSSVRTNLLKHLLTCSPNLARPLTDATMAALRSVSKQRLSRYDFVSADVFSRESSSLSFEALMKILWVIRVFEKDRYLQGFRSNPEMRTERARWELETLAGQRHRSSSLITTDARECWNSNDDEILRVGMYKEFLKGLKS